MPQGTYKHTTDNIQEITGLPRHFIHRCSSKISDILDPYRQRGDNNQLLYDDSGLTIFDQIAQLKREGKNIPEIRTVLEDQLQDLQDDSKSDRNTPQNDLQNPQNETSDKSSQTTDSEPWVEALKEAYREVATAKDEVIESKQGVIESKKETIHSLQQNLRLLTDGRNPEKVKEEHNQKIEEAAETKQKLEQLREEKRRHKEAERRRQEKREELLAELKSLEGKWFSGSRRREIITELEQLDREEERMA